jgi:hypothetical protein
MANQTKFAFSTNPITIALRDTQDLAERVRDAMTAETPQSERDQINAIIKAIEATRAAAIKIDCPNPNYGIYTVDVDKLMGGSEGQ